MAVRASVTPRYPARRALVLPLLAGAAGMAASGCTVTFQENNDVCTPGDAMCRDAATLVTCDENHVRQIIDCNEYCVTHYGENYKSYGCNADSAANPCACDYDQLDGMIAQCEPDEIYCIDQENIHYCDMSAGMENWGTPAQASCNEYCRTVYGPDFVSKGGCTGEDPENPCNCDYDVLDGDIAECLPSEILCIDNGNVAICNDSYFYDYFNCADKCVADFGNGSTSEGCDAANPQNPCLCTQPEK